jgi:hypothetical protein
MLVITGALSCCNALALCVRAHLKLYVLFHPDRDAEHQQPVTGTVGPGPNVSTGYLLHLILISHTIQQ